MTTGPELKVVSTTAMVVSFPGITHYQVGLAMDRSGLLIEGGFDVPELMKDTIVLMPKEGVSQTDVLAKLLLVIEELAGKGTIKVPAA